MSNTDRLVRHARHRLKTERRPAASGARPAASSGAARWLGRLGGAAPAAPDAAAKDTMQKAAVPDTITLKPEALKALSFDAVRPRLEPIADGLFRHGRPHRPAPALKAAAE